MEIHRPLSPAARGAGWLLGLAGLIVLAIGSGCGSNAYRQDQPPPLTQPRKAPVQTIEDRIAGSENLIKTLQADQERRWESFRQLDQKLNGLDENKLDSWTWQQRNIRTERQQVYDSIVQTDRDINLERTKLDSLKQEKAQNDAVKSQPPSAEAARELNRQPMLPPAPPPPPHFH
jgi:hypothetical protein